MAWRAEERWVALRWDLPRAWNPPALRSCASSGFREFARRRDDFLVRWNHQERGTRERGERVGAHDAPQRLGSVAGFGDGGDHALANACAMAAFVDDQDAIALRGMFGDRRLVERHQPTQIDDT